MTNNSIIEIADRIKNGDIIAKFQERSSRDLLYKNKEKSNEEKAKDLGFQEKYLIFNNEPLAFDTKKLFCNVREKCMQIGVKICHW